MASGHAATTFDHPTQKPVEAAAAEVAQRGCRRPGDHPPRLGRGQPEFPVVNDGESWQAGALGEAAMEVDLQPPGDAAQEEGAWRARDGSANRSS